MLTLRTEEGEAFYQSQKKLQDKNFCFLCERDLLRREFKYWFICENRYPYTRVSEKHDLLAIKRHIKTLEELTKEEYDELESIIYQICRRQIDYDQILFNVPHKQSNPFHFHLHLIKLISK